jgi:2-amino-4-hydroxy-6-hydroxymethyldihydropteridine diphosphokinase
MDSRIGGSGQEGEPIDAFHEAVIGLGSNLGHPPAILHLAWQELRDHPDILPLALSSLYRSQPVGMDSAHRFANAVALIHTRLSPRRLLHLLQTIECRLGRIRHPQVHGYQDRILDLDLLFYDDLILVSDDLILPHSRLEQRLFVLIPLVEIDRDRLHPVIRKSMGALCAACEKKRGNQGVEKIFRHWWTSLVSSRQ